MVTRSFVDNGSANSMTGLVMNRNLLKTSSLLAIIVGLGVVTGCNSTRFGQRTDLAVDEEAEALQAEMLREEILLEESAAPAGGIASLFSRWWPSSSKSASELQPNDSEVFISSGEESDEIQKEKSSASLAATNPAKNRSGLLGRNAKKPSKAEVAANEEDGLTPEQKAIFRRQQEAIARLNLKNDKQLQELGDAIADDELELLPLPSEEKTPADLVSAPLAKPATSNPSASGARFRLDDKPPTPQSSLSPAPAGLNAPEALASTGKVGNVSNNPQPTSMTSPETASAVKPSGALPAASTPVPQVAGALAADKQNGNYGFDYQAPAASPVSVATNGDTKQTVPASALPALPSNFSGSQPAAIAPATASTPLNTLTESTPWEMDLEQAIVKLQDRLNNDKSLTPSQKQQFEGRLRVLQVAANQVDASLETKSNYDKEELEWFRNTLQAIHLAIDEKGPVSKSNRYTEIAQRQRQANNHLDALTNLDVRNVAFCSAVDGYGSITKFPADTFRPDEKVLLYCEVENFNATAVKDGYETEFRASYEIVDLDGNRIAEVKLPEDRQTCRNKRRDYFIVYGFNLPKDLVPGSYNLKLNIEDYKGKKHAQAVVGFRITR